MYIGSIDSDGMHHLLLEVISNSIDEYLNGYGTEVKIKIDTKTNTASVSDDGRGIPFGKTDKGTEAMIDICTSLHSGGKFGQGGYSVSGGLHGIGLTAVNALSTYFNIISSRDKQTAILNSSKGRDVKFSINSLDKLFTQGTMVTFIPDQQVFGDIKFDINKIEQTVKELSYLTAGMEFYVNDKKFISKNGIKDMIKEKVSEPITDVIYLTGEQDGYKVEVAFQYVDSRSEKIHAFTNNIPNREGGTHVTGFKTAFTNTLNKLARQYGFIEEKDVNLNGDMMRSGIVAVISIKMSEAPVFQGQTKEKLMTASARGVVSQIVNATLEKSITKKDTKLIVDRALTEQKAEEAAKRAREAAKKVASGGRNMSALKDLPSKLTDCTDRSGELWLLEGNSAAGSAKNARNPKNQAIMPLRGKVLNTHDKELADIIKNKEIKDIITALGTGIHEQFNLYNLRYGKVIILSDADSDGAHINLLLLTFFMKHMPDLIIKGKIYVAIPPLFKVTAGRIKQYFYSSEELEQSKIKGEITRFKGIGEMNADELKATTMEPTTRKVMQLTTENLGETLELFETLMGNSSMSRKDFIVNSGLMNESIDYFGEEEE